MIIDDILPSWELTYPSCQRYFDDDFTFPKVGYVIVPRPGVGFHKSPLFFARGEPLKPIATLHYLDTLRFQMLSH